MQPAPTDPVAPDPVALVTGASRGLGAALAETLAGKGWQVVAVARTRGGLEELDDRIRAAGGAATLAPLDLADEGAVRAFCRALFDRFGHLDLWAHAAIHAAPLAPAGHVDARDLEKSLATNVTATARLIRLVEPLLLQARDRATALFFDDPRAGSPFFGAYGATKAAQIALARSWQAETRRTGPRVVLATPEPMPTAVRARFFPGEDRGRLADPRAEAARILATL
jgi:NAD(P)-dependent dehydrogenase (short-subunit alcohol dehydrogenase family)